jgi:hypothetical protein
MEKEEFNKFSEGAEKLQESTDYDDRGGSLKKTLYQKNGEKFLTWDSDGEIILFEDVNVRQQMQVFDDQFRPIATFKTGLCDGDKFYATIDYEEGLVVWGVGWTKNGSLVEAIKSFRNTSGYVGLVDVNFETIPCSKEAYDKIVTNGGDTDVTKYLIVEDGILGVVQT